MTLSRLRNRKNFVRHSSCLVWNCKTGENRYTVSMILEKFPGVQRLTPSEKLIFVSELWNDLEAHPSDIPVSPEVISELDQRMEHFRQHPNEFTTWEAVKERVLGPLK